MNIYLQDAIQDFNAFTNNPGQYQNQVNALSTLLGINHGENALAGNILPTYYAGHFSPQTYVIIGINPGLDTENIAFENQFRTQNWNDYRQFHDNFFHFYRRHHKTIVYYGYMAGVLASDNLRYHPNWNYFQYCEDHLLNIDIIPYHSRGFVQRHIPLQAIDYIWNRFTNNILPLLQRNAYNINKVIIHDARLFVILLQNNFFNPAIDCVLNRQTNNGVRNIYAVNHAGIEFRIFSRFIPNGGFPRNNIQPYI